MDTVFGLDLPVYGKVGIESGDLSDCEPVEYRADADVTRENGAVGPLARLPVHPASPAGLPGRDYSCCALTMPSPDGARCRST
ncbi:hypothetical protein Nans01_37620 [Nocardiopsis ansamitocini]|uniref:Uncharacterized protein n=1 Tax=Nocardiopsis ansamitocini TaxID=1670832 RepID=A0A9W6UHZ9_9ACTN|nr:hypothetical protein Nans01_37620 [Nocardiopsis ansamitocini]